MPTALFLSFRFPIVLQWDAPDLFCGNWEKKKSRTVLWKPFKRIPQGSQNFQAPDLIVAMYSPRQKKQKMCAISCAEGKKPAFLLGKKADCSC